MEPPSVPESGGVQETASVPSPWLAVRSRRISSHSRPRSVRPRRWSAFLRSLPDPTHSIGIQLRLEAEPPCVAYRSPPSFPCPAPIRPASCRPASRFLREAFPRRLLSLAQLLVQAGPKATARSQTPGKQENSLIFEKLGDVDNLGKRSLGSFCSPVHQRASRPRLAPLRNIPPPPAIPAKSVSVKSN